MKQICKIIILAALAIAALACQKEKGTEAPTFQIDMDSYGSIILEQNRQVAFIPVSTNVPEDKWTIESSENWCKASRSISARKGIMVAVGDNTDKEAMRQAQVSVSAAGQQYRIVVSQFGYGPAIVVSNVSVGPEGGEVLVSVTANIPINESLVAKPEYNAEDGEGWIRFKGISAPTKAFSTSSLIYDIAVNEMPDKRAAVIPLRAALSADSSADTQCVITQNSISVTSTDVFSDDRIVPTGVKASQVSEYEGSAEALIDGSYETYYHSPYEVATVFPVTWEFTLDGTSRIDYISVMHRAYGGTYGGHWRGQLGTVNVYYKKALTDEPTLAQVLDFGGKGGYQTMLLETPIENAVWVKFEIQDDADPDHGNYTDGQYVTCAEVEFYNSNRAEVNEWVDKIFTDASCTALKEGVTRKDIIKMNAVSPYLASNVAIPLLNGTYDEGEYDFRAHSYEPYSDNRLNQALVTRIYSALDNPTGIEVKQGTDILVCVDEIPAGQNVSLAVYGDRTGGEGPNYGGMGETEEYAQMTPLQKGINSIRVQADGMVYIMNTVPQADPLKPDTTPISQYKSVKVHILPGCGTVQGYYDPARHSEERYKELLNRCTYKYFTIKGKKVVFIFHTNQLRSDFPGSFLSGVNAWDDILSWQHELMGLDKIDWFNNHMAAVSKTGDGYMDASNRRVQFHVNTLAKIGSREALLANEGGWGPCHEMGHVNQQAINWKSSTESSNNLFSNYCVMKLAGDTYYKSAFSRGKRIADLAADYARKTPWALLGDGSYQNEDPELHMRMNWQLWNYFHNCGYMTDFWPKLFGYLRENTLPSEMKYYGKAEDLGACQMAFYEAVCEVAQLDLTEFFDAWGFFVPIDRMYDQYGTAPYTLTTQMISESKTRVQGKGYPKAAPIQYLEDRKEVSGATYSQMGYYTQFKDKPAITKTPKAQISGSVVTLTDCDQAVAVEVRRGTADSGELLYFSNMFAFTVPSGISLANCSLWAVQADGKRVAVQK